MFRQLYGGTFVWVNSIQLLTPAGYEKIDDELRARIHSSSCNSMCDHFSLAFHIQYFPEFLCKYIINRKSAGTEIVKSNWEKFSSVVVYISSNLLLMYSLLCAMTLLYAYHTYGFTCTTYECKNRHIQYTFYLLHSNKKCIWKFSYPNYISILVCVRLCLLRVCIAYWVINK